MSAIILLLLYLIFYLTLFSKRREIKPSEHPSVLPTQSFLGPSLTDAGTNKRTIGQQERRTEKDTEIKSKRFSSYWSQRLGKILGKRSGLLGFRVKRRRGSRQKCRRERLLFTWMGLVSIYSLIVCYGIYSLFSHTTSHHTPEDLAAETKHPATLPLVLTPSTWVQDEKNTLKTHWLCIVTNTNRFKNCIFPAISRPSPVEVTNSLAHLGTRSWGTVCESAQGQPGSCTLPHFWETYPCQFSFFCVFSYFWLLVFLTMIDCNSFASYTCFNITMLSYSCVHLQYQYLCNTMALSSTVLHIFRMGWCARNNITNASFDEFNCGSFLTFQYIAVPYCHLDRTWIEQNWFLF